VESETFEVTPQNCPSILAKQVSDITSDYQKYNTFALASVLKRIGIKESHAFSVGNKIFTSLTINPIEVIETESLFTTLSHLLELKSYQSSLYRQDL
jgi:hypothetical protein